MGRGKKYVLRFSQGKKYKQLENYIKNEVSAYLVRDVPKVYKLGGFSKDLENIKIKAQFKIHAELFFSDPENYECPEEYMKLFEGYEKLDLIELIWKYINPES